jgi:predicted GIY-YIG superfamily endonuclease
METRLIQQTGTSDWIVYSLADSATPGLIRYVGLTKNPDARLRGHRSDKSRSHKACWVRSVIRSGGDIILTTIESGLTYEQAIDREIYHILHMRSIGCDLTNATDGGEGVSGHIASDELRKVRSRNAKGRSHSAETRAKMSAWQTGVKRPNVSGAIAFAKRMSAPAQGRYKGVYPRGLSWTANIYVKRKQVYLGSFSTPEDAARAYDAAAVANWGSGVCLNFPANDNQNQSFVQTTR